MKDIFNLKINAKIRPFDIIANSRKTNKFGNKSLTALGRKISNQLLTEIKSKISLRFKEYIKTWFGPEYKCNACGPSYNSHLKLRTNFYIHIFKTLINWF